MGMDGAAGPDPLQQPHEMYQVHDYWRCEACQLCPDVQMRLYRSKARSIVLSGLFWLFWPQPSTCRHG